MSIVKFLGTQCAKKLVKILPTRWLGKSKTESSVINFSRTIMRVIHKLRQTVGEMGQECMTVCVTGWGFPGCNAKSVKIYRHMLLF